LFAIGVAIFEAATIAAALALVSVTTSALAEIPENRINKQIVSTLVRLFSLSMVDLLERLTKER
jgi:hypothetical protein